VPPEGKMKKLIRRGEPYLRRLPMEIDSTGKLKANSSGASQAFGPGFSLFEGKKDG